MDGKQFFIDCCREQGVVCDDYFKIGRGKKTKNRYVYSCSLYTRKSSQIFAIKYFTDENVYVAWDLREKGADKRSIFSLSNKKRAIDLSIASIKQVPKDIEYSGRGEEVVYVFPPECVNAFLKRNLPIIR